MKRLMIIAALICTACGGGGGGSNSASALDTILSPAAAASVPAQPMATNLREYPTTVTGRLYSERQEMVDALPLTTSSPYNWSSIYSVTIPDLQSTDTVFCVAQFEVSDNLGDRIRAIQIDRAIGIGVTNQAMLPTIPGFPANGENITPVMHHMTGQVSILDTGRTGAVTYSLQMSAASTDGEQGDAITVEQDYGSLTCTVTH